jgi:hypothetical protein
MTSARSTRVEAYGYSLFLAFKYVDRRFEYLGNQQRILLVCYCTRDQSLGHAQGRLSALKFKYF